MGLIAMPPAPPRADLDLNLFLGGGRAGEVGLLGLRLCARGPAAGGLQVPAVRRRARPV